ncbi:DUF6493 family protein [Pseudoduganella sp. UC29_106]|uniref:DUF6493 family protein n=1 Tax=Pseudoduganella sp. UC29_106 TaxID=3374553 RepID=UPI003757C6EF
MSFVPKNALETLIHAGDGEGVLNALERMDVQEREALTERLSTVADLMKYWWYDREAVHASWGMRTTDGQRDAVAVAMVVCGTAHDAAKYRLPARRLVEVARRFMPRSLDGLAKESAFANIAASLALAREGLSEFTMDEEAVLRLIALPRMVRSLREYLVLHAEELKPVLPLLFEVQGTGEDNLSAIDKYSGGEERTWAWNLLRLCDDGVLDRASLLASCLDTLEQDWPQFRAGWFSRFHDMLAPTVDEMDVHSQRYLGLLHSRIPPTVTLALKAVGKLAPRLEARDVMDGLLPVMLSAVKAQITGALKLLDALVKRDGRLRHEAAHIALSGLQHPEPEVQMAIVTRLAQWGLDAPARDAAADMLPFVAASVRPQFEQLLGDTQPADGPVWRDIALPPRAEPATPVDPARALAAPATLDDLIAICARLLEDESDLDLLEIAIGALAAAAPFAPDAAARFAPLLKRARKLKHDRWEYKGAVSYEFARLLLALVTGEQRESPWEGKGAAGVLAERIDDVIAGAGSVPLDTATHRGGFIDAVTLVQRAAVLGPAVAELPLRAQVRALLRLAPGQGGSVLATAEALPATPFSRALCYALGGDWPQQPVEALCLAAARIRYPHDDDPIALTMFGAGVPDGAMAAVPHLRSEFVQSQYSDYYRAKREVVPPPVPVTSELLAPFRYQDFWQGSHSLVMFGASLFPSSQEAMYAEALPDVAMNVQYAEARWHHAAYFRLLGEPVTKMTSAATLLLALGLMEKEPRPPGAGGGCFRLRQPGRPAGGGGAGARTAAAQSRLLFQWTAGSEPGVGGERRSRNGFRGAERAGYTVPCAGARYGKAAAVDAGTDVAAPPAARRSSDRGAAGAGIDRKREGDQGRHA